MCVVLVLLFACVVSCTVITPLCWTILCNFAADDQKLIALSCRAADISKPEKVFRCLQCDSNAKREYTKRFIWIVLNSIIVKTWKINFKN